MATAVILPHAGALAMKARRVPACWSAFLVLPVQLDHIDLLMSSQRKFDHAVEPCGRNFPGLELRTPVGLRASAIPQPLHIPFGERDARPGRTWSTAERRGGTEGCMKGRSR